MAYNPFDDVILNDPAYMANGGQLPRPKIGIEFPQATQQEEPRAQLSVRPTNRIDYSQTKDTFKPIASAIAKGYQLLTPEQETLDQIERDQQLRSLATAQAFTGTDFEEYAGEFDLPSTVLQDQRAMDLLNNVGFKREGFTEGLSRVGQFFYGNQRKAFDKLKSGEQLNSDDRLSIALAPLDSLDFLFPPLILKKLAGLGLKNVNAVLKSTSDLPEVQQVKQFFGGSPLPSSGIADGPPGMTRQQVNLAPADEGSPGRYDKLDDRIRKSQEARAQKNYEPLRDSFNEYTKQNQFISPSGFLDFVEKSGGSIASKGKDRAAKLTVVRRILNYFDPEKKIQRVSGEYAPWMNAAEKILRETNQPSIFSTRLKDQLKDQGFKVTGEAITKWAKSGKNFQDPKLAQKVNTGDLRQQARTETSTAVDNFIKELEADPKKQNLGQQKYDPIQLPSGKTITVKSLLQTGRGGYGGLSTKQIEKLEELALNQRPSTEDLFTQYIPRGTKELVDGKNMNVDYDFQLGKIRNYFRSKAFGNIDDFENLAETYGILKKTDPAYDLKQNKEAIARLFDDVENRLAKGMGKKFPNLQKDYLKIYNETVNLSKYTSKNFEETVRSSPTLSDRVFAEMKRHNEVAIRKAIAEGRTPPREIKTLDEAIQAAKKNFSGHISHIYRISDFVGNEKGLKGLGNIPFLVRVNFGGENIALQNMAENVIDNAVDVIRRNIGKDNDAMDAALNNIRYFNEVMKKKGMAAYRRLDKDTLTPEVIKKINEAIGGVDKRSKLAGVIKGNDKFNDILIGSKKGESFKDKTARFDRLMKALLKDPSLFKISDQSPKAKDVVVDGFTETPYARFGFFNFSQKAFDIDPEIRFNKGGAVRMAIGGDPLENINQQQFAPDPAFEGKDFFQEAVDSGNLTAFNPLKLFKTFGKVDAVETPKKKIQTDTQEGPPGTTLPATQDMQPSDFALKSFTLETIMDPNAPKAARPQDWQNFFKGKAAPEAELRDSGILQYLGDFNKYFPNQKITQQQLVDFYETSPMGNISIKVKEAPTGKDAGFENFVGRPRHQGTGQQPLDEVGKDYREVVVQAGPLPGEGKPFVASGHFQEENVIGFTRVATYDNASGQPVAVIQELQTDMLTKVRKEQERLNALLKRIENVKAKAQERIASTDEYYRMQGQRQLDGINQAFPPATLQKLQENLSAIKPFPNTAGAELIPTYSKELSDLQKEINKLADIDITNPNPQTIFGIDAIETQQQKVLDNLLDLTRDSELERDLKGIQVPSTRESDELIRFGESADDMNLQYGGFKDLELFPPIPFNKQPDYVDLLIKATIKDAQTKGINKVAIMPAEKVNRRWGKDPDGPEGKKFKNLYDQVAVQQLKNIAKKYKGNVAIEQIVDKTKANKGLKFFNKNVDGEFTELLKDLEPRGGNSAESVQEFLNEEIEKIALNFGDKGPSKEVVLRKEIAPGQTMEYYVQLKSEDGFDLVPLGDADKAEDATIIIDEYNPQAIDMVTLTLDSPQSKEPFFMFKKKDGGTIAKDSLLSVTDIFGQYGR